MLQHIFTNRDIVFSASLFTKYSQSIHQHHKALFLVVLSIHHRNSILLFYSYISIHFSDIASTLICHHYHHFLLSHLFYCVNKEYTTVISESYYHISIGELHMITYYKLWDYCNRKDINKTELKEAQEFPMPPSVN